MADQHQYPAYPKAPGPFVRRVAELPEPLYAPLERQWTENILPHANVDFHDWVFHNHSDVDGNLDLNSVRRHAAGTTAQREAAANRPTPPNTPRGLRAPAEREAADANPVFPRTRYVRDQNDPRGTTGAFTPRAIPKDGEAHTTIREGTQPEVRSGSLPDIPELVSGFDEDKLRRVAMELGIPHHEYDSATGTPALQTAVAHGLQHHASMLFNPDGSETGRSHIRLTATGEPVYAPRSPLTPGERAVTVIGQLQRNSNAANIIRAFSHYYPEQAPDGQMTREGFRQAVMKAAQDGDTQALHNLRGDGNSRKAVHEEQVRRQTAAEFHLSDPSTAAGRLMLIATDHRSTPEQRAAALSVLNGEGQAGLVALGQIGAAQQQAQGMQAKELAAMEAQNAERDRAERASADSLRAAHALPNLSARIQAMTQHVMTHMGLGQDPLAARAIAEEMVLEHIATNGAGTPALQKQAADHLLSMPEPKFVEFAVRHGLAPNRPAATDLYNSRNPQGIFEWLGTRKPKPQPPFPPLNPPG